MIQPLKTAVYFIVDFMEQFAFYDFPGTDIPIVVLLTAPLAVYVLWKVFVHHFFGGRD